MVVNSSVGEIVSKGIGFMLDMREDDGLLLGEDVSQMLNKIFQAPTYGFIGGLGSVEGASGNLDGDLRIPFNHQR